jgi:hypothetical protein
MVIGRMTEERQGDRPICVITVHAPDPGHDEGFFATDRDSFPTECLASDYQETCVV